MLILNIYYTMFQPTVAENVRRSMTRRLEAARRSFHHRRNEMSSEELRNLESDVITISRHIGTLELALPNDVWSALRSSSSELLTEMGDGQTPSSQDSSHDDGPSEPNPKFITFERKPGFSLKKTFGFL